MSQEPSIDPQPGQIADGMVEIHGATEVIGRRGVRPADATVGAQPVDGPAVAADSPATRAEVAAPETSETPGAGARRKRARAGAGAILFGAATSVLAAIRRRRRSERLARADVEVSLTAGVVTGDDSTTPSSDDARPLDLPQQAGSEPEQARADDPGEAPEGAASVSLTAGVIEPDERTPTTDPRRE